MALAVRAPIDADYLTERLGNLFYDAVSHTHSRVWISWAEVIDGASQAIVADGPSIAEADRTSVLERGTCLDESTQGTGFGLVITHDIATAYGLTPELERGDIGGSAVAVGFRLATDWSRRRSQSWEHEFIKISSTDKYRRIHSITEVCLLLRNIRLFLFRNVFIKNIP